MLASHRLDANIEPAHRDLKADAVCTLTSCMKGSCTPLNCPMLQEAGNVRLFSKGDVIYWDGDKNDRVYIVLSGVVRGSKLLSDGRRQICRFAFPGSLIDYARGDAVGFTAEAISPVRVVSIPRAVVEGSIKCTPCLSDLMMRVVLEELGEARDQLLMLGRLSASERVYAFLKTVADHMGVEDNGTFKVPMSRQDMADYLGLTIETVSRVISQFKRDGALRLFNNNRMAFVVDAQSTAPAETTAEKLDCAAIA